MYIEESNKINFENRYSDINKSKLKIMTAFFCRKEQLNMG